MTQGPLRIFFLSLGWLSLALGVIGIFLPLLPTVPFILLSAFCFSKSSAKMHDYLITHPALGPFIKDWEKHGVIRRRSKFIASIMITLLFGCTLIFVSVALWIKIILVIIAISILLFIWTRPSLPSF